MRRVTLNDIELAVVDSGTGPPLLLVHGFPLDHSMWREQVAVLQRSHRVIAPDLRGFGKSGVTAGTVTMNRLADDLSELLDALAVSGPVTLCGLSMGGYVAWQCWRRFPLRIGRLVLCDTRAAADAADVAQNRLLLAEQVLREGVSAVPVAMLPRLFCETTVRQRPEIVEQTRQVMLSTSPEGMAATLRGMAQRDDATPWLPALDVPCLVICGEHDAISTVSEMRTIAQALPRGRLIVIRDAGHMAPLEQPAAVNQAILDFLRGR